MTEAAIFVVFPFCLGFAAFSDLLTMTIPNRVSVVLLGSFLVVALMAGLDFGRSACIWLRPWLSLPCASACLL